MQIETPQAVAIYCRLSKEDLDENKIDNLSRSIQNQKSMLTDFAKINGWQIFDIYCDEKPIALYQRHAARGKIHPRSLPNLGYPVRRHGRRSGYIG